MNPTADLSNIVTALSTFEEGNLPKEAISAAGENWPEMWPLIKQLMVKFTNSAPSLSEAELNFLFMGIFLAVQQKEYEAFPLLSQICESSVEFEDEFETLLGDSICELLPRFLYILSDGDTLKFEQLIQSENTGVWVKTGIAEYISSLYISGIISRVQLVDMVSAWLDHFSVINNELSEIFLAILAMTCVDADLHEFKAQLLSLANKFELAPEFITPEEIDEWKTNYNEKTESVKIDKDFDMIDELSNWAAYKTPEQNAEDNKALAANIDKLIGENPEAFMDTEFDQSLDYDDFYDPIQIPYVAEAKVGRNDPCTCGSGKKYKKCCML